MRRLTCLLSTLVLGALLSACGSGAQPAQSVATTVKAVVKATSLTADLNIAAIGLTITVPVGVAPPLLADGTVDAAAAVEITSSAPRDQILPGASYTPATATAPGQLLISAIVAAGFQASDQVTIHLNIAAGALPVAGDFKLLSFEAFNTDGVLVAGLSPSLTTAIQ